METQMRTHIVGEKFRALYLISGEVAERYGEAWTFESFGTLGAYPGFRDEAGNWVPLHAVLRALK